MFGRSLDAWDSTVAILRSSLWIVSTSTTWLRDQLHSTGHLNTKNYSNQSEIELVKIRSLLCPQPRLSFPHSRGFIERWDWLYPNSTVSWRKTLNFLQLQIFRQSRTEDVYSPQRAVRNSFSFTNLWTLYHWILLPIYLYCNHKPILYLWGRKGQLSQRFFRYQVIITKFQKLKILWTPGSNLAFPDILSL